MTLTKTMLTDQFIEDQKKQLQDLGDMLHKEATFSKGFVASKNPLNEREWFSAVQSVSIYGTYLIKNTISTLDEYKKFSPEQIGFYIGKIAIQSFLDIINSFELSTNKLVESSSTLQSLLDTRIKQKLDLFEENWSNNTGRHKKLKNSIEHILMAKKREMKFIRDTLKKEKIIDDLDYKILEFSWDIRNSMHNNFLAIRDIEFSAPGTNLNYSFQFKKGQELYHPRDLKSFYSMTEQIIFIQLKIIQYFNKK